MTDAAHHPLIGSTVSGYTLDRVHAVWACATDFDASRRLPADADTRRRPSSAVMESRRSLRQRPAREGTQGFAATGHDHERVRVRVWHAPDVAAADEPPPRVAQRAAKSFAVRRLPRTIRLFLRLFGRAARLDRVVESAVPPAEPPERTRRRELDLAADRRIRSDVIPRPSALSTTEPGIRAPFGSCDAALFPALGESFGTSLHDGRDARIGGDSALAVLMPLLNGVIELLEAGYEPQPLVLGALARDVLGAVVVIDTSLVAVRSEQADAAGRDSAAKGAEAGVSPVQGSAPRAKDSGPSAKAGGAGPEFGDAPSRSGADRAQIPPRKALSALVPVVDQLSALLEHAGEQKPAGETLSARWAAWCEQIEGASARAALTLLEAQLVAWHGGARDAASDRRRLALDHPDREHPANDEAAPTEVDAA